MAVQVTSPTERDLPELADVAARTFPLACPPSARPDDVAAFIAENLSQARFADYLADPDRVVLTARADGRILGYAMLIRGVADDADVQRAVPLRPAVELSKMYVLPDAHGAGVSAALMAAALDAGPRARRRVRLARRQPGKPTRPTVLRQARLRRQRHQDLPARRGSSRTTT